MKFNKWVKWCPLMTIASCSIAQSPEGKKECELNDCAMFVQTGKTTGYCGLAGKETVFDVDSEYQR